MATVSNFRGRNGGASHGIIDDVLAMAGSLASSRKEALAAKFETVAESLRTYSEVVPGIPRLGEYASAAANSLEDLSSYVQESDLPTMLGDAREFSRRHPVATLAGSITAGVILTQLMQSRTTIQPVKTSRRRDVRQSRTKS